MTGKDKATNKTDPSRERGHNKVTEPILIMTRAFPDDAPVKDQVREFYDRWSIYNETKRSFEQVEQSLHFAERSGTSIVGDPVTAERDQQERAAALPILKLGVLEALERVEKLPNIALQSLSKDDRINLRWALVSIQQARAREEDLARLQKHHQAQERDDDRHR